MFRKKSKAEQVKSAASDRAHHAGEVAAQVKSAASDRAHHAGEVAAQVKDRATDFAGQAATSARELGAEWTPVAKEKASAAGAVAKEKAGSAAAGAGAASVAIAGILKELFSTKVAPHTGNAGEKIVAARDRAVAGLDHGIDVAVPKSQDAVASLAPRVDHARDVLVDDVLPKLQEFLGQVQSGKNDLLAKTGAVEVVTGAPKKPKKKGGLLLTLGLLTGAAAAVAYVLNKKQAPAENPWAGGSRPIGGAPGVDSQVRKTVSPVAATDAEQPQPAAPVATPESGASEADTDAAPEHDSVATADLGKVLPAEDMALEAPEQPAEVLREAQQEESQWPAGAETAASVAEEEDNKNN